MFLIGLCGGKNGAARAKLNIVSQKVEDLKRCVVVGERSKRALMFSYFVDVVDMFNATKEVS